MSSLAIIRILPVMPASPDECAAGWYVTYSPTDGDSYGTERRFDTEAEAMAQARFLGVPNEHVVPNSVRVQRVVTERATWVTRDGRSSITPTPADIHVLDPRSTGMIDLFGITFHAPTVTA